MIEQRTHGRVHYSWIVAAVTFVIILTTAGIRSVPGILILPFEAEFGWSRATISLAVSINLLMFGLCGPFAAAVMDKVGMRRLMVATLLMLAISVALTTQMRASWQLQLLWGLVVGLGTGAMGQWVSATVANRWFVQRRGLVVGLLTSAGAVGQLLFLPLLAWLVVNHGWRSVVLAIAGFALLVVPLVAKFIYSHPRDIGLRPYGDSGDDGASEEAVTVSSTPTAGIFATAFGTLRREIRNRDFLLLSGSFFVCGASTNGLIATHLIPNSIEHGIPEVTAAGLLSLMSLFNMAGSTFSGWLSDRFDSRGLLVWFYSLRGLSLLFLPFAYDIGFFGLAAFIVFYGLDWVATVPTTIRLTADIYGRERAGSVYAWIAVAHQFGAAGIAFGAGALRAWLGSYTEGFMLSGFLCLLAAGLVLRIGRPAHRDVQPKVLVGKA